MKVNGETLKMILDSLSEITQLVRSLEARISVLEVNQQTVIVHPGHFAEDLPLKFTGIDKSRFTGTINADYQFPKQSLIDGDSFSVTREQDGI